MSFSLRFDQVPMPPETGDVVDSLRWMLCVMDADDAHLCFVVSLLAYALSKGALDKRLSWHFARHWVEVSEAFAAGDLVCQRGGAARIGGCDG